MMQRASRYLHTLRHLQPGQLAWRVYFLLNRRPRLPLGDLPGRRPPAGRWTAPARLEPSLLGPDRILLLNEERDISGASGWSAPGASLLWRYNVHYFDDLNARGAREREAWHRRLIQRWIEENPPAAGTGWGPYPSSLRMVNWIKWALDGNELEPAWEQSLALQARHLTRRLERNIRGNHLLANVKALTFAGLFFSGPEAERWYRLGAGLLARELAEQLLPDGANYELSTLYHALCLADLLDLDNLHRAYLRDPPEVVRKAIPPAVRWLAGLCHPDGEISFFNDAALGIAPSVEEVLGYVGRLGYEAPAVPPPRPGVEAAAGPRLTDFPDSGYSRVEWGEALALVDRAEACPDHLTGHAHADTLSFELSLFGSRVIVNSGTSVYGTGPDRQEQRGTAAHATVVLDGEDSSETWAGFRVARRARIHHRTARTEGDTLHLEACHDGYQRLCGRPLHCRCWEFSGPTLRITDRITGRGVHTADVVFPLHPDVAVTAAGPDRWTLEVAGRPVQVAVTGHGTAMVAASSFHPRFGVSLASSKLVFRSRGRLPLEITTVLSW